MIDALVFGAVVSESPLFSISQDRLVEVERGIDDDGQVLDRAVSTAYAPLEKISTDEDCRVIRIVGDFGPEDIEIRIPFEVLENIGWRRM